MKEVTDRIVQYPRRFKLTKVAGTEDEYELTPVPGTVQEAGTPINKELFDSIKTDIENEKTSRESKDTEHDTAISSNAEAISAEAQTRAQADIDLASKITAEENERKAADIVLSDSISDEADAREQAIEAVNTKADNHIKDKNNPHAVTKAQVGLSAVDNVRQYSAENEPPYPVTSVDGKIGEVTTEAVKYTEQKLKEGQRQRAQNNIGIKCCDYNYVSVGTQGWHNLLEISSNAKGTCFISHGYNYRQPFVMSFDFSIAVGYTYNITITASGQGTGNSGIYKLRFAQINGRYYIQLYFPYTQDETFRVAAYTDSDVYPCIVLDNTVTNVDSQFIAAEIEVKNGINTTGNIYQNGNQVAQLSQIVPNNIYVMSRTAITVDWDNINWSDFDSVFGSGWRDRVGTYLCRINTTGNISQFGFSGSYYCQIQVWYASSTIPYALITISDTAPNEKFGGAYLYANVSIADSITQVKFYKNLSIDPTTLTPSTDNGWIQGSLDTNLSAFEPGEYYVCCTSFTSQYSNVIYSYGTVVVSGKAYEAFVFTISNGSGGTLNFVGTTSLSGYYDYWVSHTRYTITAATLWFKKK